MLLWVFLMCFYPVPKYSQIVNFFNFLEHSLLSLSFTYHLLVYSIWKTTFFKWQIELNLGYYVICHWGIYRKQRKVIIPVFWTLLGLYVICQYRYRPIKFLTGLLIINCFALMDMTEYYITKVIHYSQHAWLDHRRHMMLSYCTEFHNISILLQSKTCLVLGKH